MYAGQKVGAVIVAAGESRRMNGQNKLLAVLAGKPVLGYVLDVFLHCSLIDQIVIPIRQQDSSDIFNIIQGYNTESKISICFGGVRRQNSVASALSQLHDCEWVVIHDGARPLVTTELIENGLAAARESGAAIAAVPVTDTIKIVNEDLYVCNTPPRQKLWSVQTPQIFRYSLLSAAHQQIHHDVTDDATMVEEMGGKIKVFMGSYHNIKITTPVDLLIAERLLTTYEYQI